MKWCTCMFVVLFSRSPFFFSFFLEFIKCVCELRWMCGGGGVACYVECTNVVNKW